jgi:hypothetical protein
LIGNFRLEPGNHSAAEQPEKGTASPKRGPVEVSGTKLGGNPLQSFSGANSNSTSPNYRRGPSRFARSLTRDHAAGSREQRYFIRRFAASPHLRLILGQVAPRLDLSFTMNNKRILIANLAKGTISQH